MLPEWVGRYERRWLRADVVAGLTVLAYLLPQVLAYSAIVGVPPIAGLATSVVALGVYALIGRSRLASVGPESATALVTGSVLAPTLAAHPEDVVSVMALLTLCVAGWLGLAALLRAGALAQLLSHPILTGYLAGAAALMVASQLGRATGTATSGDDAVAVLTSFLSHRGQVHWPSVGVTAGTLVLLWMLPRLHAAIPGPLVAVAVVTVLSAVFGGADTGLAELGAVPQGLPPFTVPSLDPGLIGALVLGALSTAVVSFSNTMLVQRAFSEFGEQPDADAELRASALIHAASAFIGGYPSSASGSRAALAKRAGQRTQMANLVTAGGVALVALAAGPVLQHLPQAALAAIVFWAASKLVAVREFVALWRFRRAEFLIAVVTTTGTVMLGILPGIALAIVLSAIHVLTALARPHEAVQGYVEGKAGLHDIDDYSEHTTIAGLLIYRYDGPIFAYNVDDFRSRLLAVVQRMDPRWVILNVEANMFVDYSACRMLAETIELLHGEGRTVGLARLKHDLALPLEAGGVLAMVGEHTYATLPEAIRAFEGANPDLELPPMPAAGEAFTAPREADAVSES